MRHLFFLIASLLFCQTFSATANPTNKLPSLLQKAARLPVSSAHHRDAVLLNESWRDIAHILRVRDLRVYRFPFSQSDKKG